MDNANINNENLLPKLKITTSFFTIMAVMSILIIALFLIMFDVKFTAAKSDQQVTADVFIILFFSLLVFGVCVLFLPSMKEFRELFSQIGNVTYVILYTIFTILFYTMVPNDILKNYYYLINPAILGLGGFAFYKGTTDNYVEKFNINYERIKMLIILFCFITIIITFYNINPGGSVQKYFGYSLLLTIIISVFAFLYLLILMNLPSESEGSKPNLLSNFSSFGVYGSALFIIFLVLITILISSNKSGFFANKSKASGVIILLLIICILWTLLLTSNLFSVSQKNIADIKNIDLFKNSLLILFGLVISGLLIYWITYNIESLSGKSSIVSFILNLLIVLIILALIYKTINVRLPSGNSNKNAFFSLIINIILYLPCLVSGSFDLIGKQFAGEYRQTETGSVIMLVTAILLLVAYFKTPAVLNSINTQGGKQLVNRPVSTDVEYNLGSYQELNGSDNFDYQYAISCWIFLDAAPPNTNPNYNNFTSLLNFGNKPNILYNPSKNEIMITMDQRHLANNTNNKLIDFDSNGNRIIYLEQNVLLQKWNNIIINYSGGTMDIFMNGQLVKSSIEVVPYYTYDNLLIGQNGGIKGGICNVVYFRHPLTSTNVYYLYNTVKDKTPPVYNDSNKTLLVTQK